MKKCILLLVFSLFCTQSFGEKDNLEKSLSEYFSNLKKQYSRTKNWDFKVKIYRVFFTEFAALIQENAKGADKAKSFYYLGLSSGYFDLAAHTSFLEDQLYEGEWLKTWGTLLKKTAPKAYSQISNTFRQTRMTFYQLEKNRRQREVEKLVARAFRIITSYLKNNELSDHQKLILSGYLNAYTLFRPFNQFLEGEITLENYVNLLIQALKPGK